jgi:hypothetical protein
VLIEDISVMMQFERTDMTGSIFGDYPNEK